MIHVGDCRDIMRRLIADGVKVQCVVTSPPYWALRDYGVVGQLGMESTLQEWVSDMVEVFSLVRDLLANDGTLWLNLGDAYASGGGTGHQGKNGQRANRKHTQRALQRNTARDGLKPKDMMGQPWRLAFALQDAGWYLRSDIIWHKPNPMPESTKDRPTKSHEYVFLLSRSPRYHYDAKAISEPVTGNSHVRGTGVNPKCAGWADGPGSHATVDHAKARANGTKFGRPRQNSSFSAAVNELVDTRNARTVWTIPTEPTSFAHFACSPRELARRCILAGSEAGDVVFDPFMGSGTVAEVALSLGRQYLGCELNPKYVEMFRQHRSQQTGMAL